MRFKARPKPIIPGPNQESVWSYPRPPKTEKFTDKIEIKYEDQLLVMTKNSIKLMEEASPPTYYVPKSDIHMDNLQRISGKSSYCEWKGKAHYYKLTIGTLANSVVVWGYLDPNPEYESIKDHIAFYPHHLKCRINGEEVRSQEGNFYGGWITSNIVGPFKGALGTGHW